MIRKNIGPAGRLLRFAIALLLFAYAYWKESGFVLILAVFTFFEACFSWCIVYRLLGKNSCPIKKR